MLRGSSRAPNMRRPEEHTKRLTSLAEVNHTLFVTLNRKAAIQRALEVLERDHGMSPGVVTLLDEESGELRVEAANGTTSKAKGRHGLPVERIIRRVVRSGNRRSAWQPA